MPYVYVEVDLAEFDTDELLDELYRRGTRGTNVSVLQIYEALHAGNQGEALRLAREFVQDETGRIV